MSLFSKIKDKVKDKAKDAKDHVKKAVRHVEKDVQGDVRHAVRAIQRDVAPIVKHAVSRVQDKAQPIVREYVKPVVQRVQRKVSPVGTALRKFHDFNQKLVFKGLYYAHGGAKGRDLIHSKKWLRYFAKTQDMFQVVGDPDSQAAKRLGSETKGVRTAYSVQLAVKAAGVALTIATAGVGALVVQPAVAVASDIVEDKLGTQWKPAVGAAVGVVKGVATSDYVGAAVSAAQGAIGVAAAVQAKKAARKEEKAWKEYLEDQARAARGQIPLSTSPAMNAVSAPASFTGPVAGQYPVAAAAPAAHPASPISASVPPKAGGQFQAAPSRQTQPASAAAASLLVALGLALL